MRFASFRLRSPGDSLRFEQRNELEEFELDQHDSLKAGVGELRRLYDEEENRRSSIESKTGQLIAINGIILSLLQIDQSILDAGFLALFIFSLFIVSILICVWNLVPKGYQKPIAINEYPRYTQKEDLEFNIQLFTGYYTSSIFNRELNNMRYTHFLISVTISALGIITIAISLI